MPKVCVQTVSRDNARFLPCAARALALEPFADFEWLYVDNASSDASLAVLDAELSRLPSLKARTRVEALGSRLPLGDARRRACDLSSSPFFVVLDGDDVLIPGRIEARVAALEARPELGCVYGAVRTVGEDGRDLGSSVGTPFSRFLLASGNIVTHPGAMLRSSSVREAGGYKECFENFAEDYFLWARLALSSELLFDPLPVCLYRKRPGQASSAWNPARDRELRSFIAKALFAERPELEAALKAGGSLRLEAKDKRAFSTLLAFHAACSPLSPAAALSAFKLAEAVDPDDFGVLSLKARLLAALGKQEEAAACGEDFARRFGSRPDLRFELAKLRFELAAAQALKPPFPPETAALAKP